MGSLCYVLVWKSSTVPCLQAKPDTYILVVNHENITNCWYRGNDPHMMVVNCLFRMGGAAALLSNKYDLPAEGLCIFKFIVRVFNLLFPKMPGPSTPV